MTGAGKSAAWAASGAALTLALLMATGALHRGGDDDNQVTVTGTADVEAGDGIIKLNARQIRHVAIVTQSLAAGSAAEMRQGFAHVLDLSPLAAIQAEMATARSALTASRAEAFRLEALAAQDQSASTQAVEAARAQASADAARLTLAQRRIGLEFGPGLARMDAVAQDKLIAAAVAGKAALLRIDMMGAPLAVGSTVDVSDGKQHQLVRILGSAASVDSRMQGPTMLAVLPTPLAARAMAGRQFSANTAGTEIRSGIIVPRSALIRWLGGLWLYRQTGKGTFERVAVQGALPTPDGWLVTRTLKAGDQIVTGGAATLFAIEHSGSTLPEDD